ncbi:DUF1727 domain-containing protein [Candidatus Daviesbacteria bacterium]|nr:DUF1727 domain-containing protein [Candidatus Daviesbacteria bacterium]
MLFFPAILLGKTIAYFTKFFNLGGGSAAPGLYALKLEPNLVEKLSSNIPKNIVITGTNGKTTTSKMLAHFAKNSGLKVIRNHTGSNLERGIASTLISNYTLHPRPYLRSSEASSAYTLDLGIWELDEAAFNSVAPKLKPEIVVFLNVFRDQLDRYGEVDSMVKKWCQTLKTLDPKTLVLVNGDDANTAELKKCFTGKVQKFGVKGLKITGEATEHQQGKGKLDYEARNIKFTGLKNSNFSLLTHNSTLLTRLPVPGLYHIYDFLASFAAGVNLGLAPKQIISSLKSYSPAFGRVEKLPFGHIFLIKNPAGATQVFETITPNIKPNDTLLLALNDNLADGTDVSWIWDAKFEKLRTTNYKLQTICSGARAYDLANRLKYAGFDPEKIIIEPELNKAFKQARRNQKGHLFILPTYTAMLELQSILVKAGIKKHYWETES